MNESDAALALMGRLPLIGEGYFRKVYMKDGTVYKVMVCFEDGDVNIDEWNVYQTIDRSNLPSIINIPNTRLFTINGHNVIAMDYINGKMMGECYCLADEEGHNDCLNPKVLDTIVKATGVFDLGYGNVIIKDGVYWLVDMAL